MGAAMKRIRILNSVASPDWCFDPGTIVTVGEKFVTNQECPRAFAEKWVRGGVIAEAMEDEPEPVVEPEPEEETATLPPAPERAVARRGKRKHK